MSDFLELFQLGKTFATRHGPFVAVEGFDLELARGEFVALVGHSGCGKSTVLSMVAGLAEPTHGGIVLDGREIDGPGPDRGVVFQAPSLLPWLTALENVLLGVDRVFAHGTKAERRQIAEHHLHQVGLGDVLHARPGELSQGQRQRVGIARAFALDPKLLLLDEPFGMLDSFTRLELQDVLVALLARTGTTALMVTHDVDEALFLSDRVALMTKGPRARLGEILRVDLPRPRERAAVLEHPDYYCYRERLIAFLESQEEEPDERPAAELADEAAAALAPAQDGAAA
ncbi:MAG TPA: ABC transporter ATP-binding protein [Myxococcota bacterium]|jgi:nitrate ABC transporter ATP-binding subunit|nr:ABC transporter ATP-binding protein [Myxococcota bacterium]